MSERTRQDTETPEPPLAPSNTPSPDEIIDRGAGPSNMEQSSGDEGSQTSEGYPKIDPPTYESCAVAADDVSLYTDERQEELEDRLRCRILIWGILLICMAIPYAAFDVGIWYQTKDNKHRIQGFMDLYFAEIPVCIIVGSIACITQQLSKKHTKSWIRVTAWTGMIGSFLCAASVAWSGVQEYRLINHYHHDRLHNHDSDFAEALLGLIITLIFRILTCFLAEVAAVLIWKNACRICYDKCRPNPKLVRYTKPQICLVDNGKNG